MKTANYSKLRRSQVRDLGTIVALIAVMILQGAPYWALTLALYVSTRASRDLATAETQLLLDVQEAGSSPAPTKSEMDRMERIEELMVEILSANTASQEMIDALQEIIDDLREVAS